MFPNPLYLRSLLISALALILTLTGAASPAPIIADHTSVQEFDDGLIPDHWIEQVKSRGIVFHLTGESHAQQLVGDGDDAGGSGCIGGLEALEDLDPKYNVQVACDMDDLTESNALRVVKGQYIGSSWKGGAYECRNEDEHYWTTPTGRQYTQNSIQQAADQGDTIYASGWLWSWHVIKGYASDELGNSGSFDDARRDDYFSYLAGFNTNTVGTKVLYVTAVTDINTLPDPDYIGTKGWRVTRYNQDFRDEAIANDGVVFDQADIENWDYDNSEQRIETWDGHTLYLRHEDYDGSDCGHANTELGIKKAKALWWLAARLAGWPGVSGEECQGCVGLTGNVDNDPFDTVDLGDLTALIDYLFISFIPPVCIEEANIDGSDGGTVDLGDLTALIDYLFISFTPPAPCP